MIKYFENQPRSMKILLSGFVLMFNNSIWGAIMGLSNIELYKIPAMILLFSGPSILLIFLILSIREIMRETKSKNAEA